MMPHSPNISCTFRSVSISMLTTCLMCPPPLPLRPCGLIQSPPQCHLFCEASWIAQRRICLFLSYVLADFAQNYSCTHYTYHRAIQLSVNLSSSPHFYPHKKRDLLKGTFWAFFIFGAPRSVPVSVIL